jgi:membrane protein
VLLFLRAAKDTVLAVNERRQRHNLTVQAAGIAFFAFLSMLPALTATLSIYGLIADPDQIERQILDLLEAAPEETQAFVIQQLQAISTSSGGGLTVTFAFSLVLALWGASGAVNQLLRTLNQVWETTDERGGITVRLMALGLTLGAIVLLSAAGFVVAALPVLLSGGGAELVNILRFPGVAVVMVLALGVLYRLGPHRPGARWRPVTTGAVVATGLWVLASVAFGAYVTYFGSYSETYGVIAGLVVLQLWLLLTALLVLIGGEVDASLELRKDGL